ncbi:glycosyltransferase family 2 protein [Lacihabitans lacunae]|uniref:Glycosyltransferase family 2 protein n=1 Tax=Lacihabitans lacunae TaxID=1028214 RepID=A0ABV7Z1I8_9BACT
MKISIITVVYNGERYIKDTIESVVNQTYNNIEYIVIDGKSSDSTLSIINQYKANISNVISEKDKSMYDAINKGLKIATGDFVLILNSDDFLVNCYVISEIVNLIQKNLGFEFYYGNLSILKGNTVSKRNTFQCSYSEILHSRHGTFIPHPALFISKKIAQKHIYNLKYLYASDFDYILNLAKTYESKFLQITVTVFRSHSESITSSGKINNERKLILKSNDLYKTNFIVRSFLFIRIWLYYKLIQYVNL